MSLKIEEGKFYRTGDGRKVGPMRYREGVSALFRWTDEDISWGDDGQHCSEPYCGLHIVAEWAAEPTGPVRTVTRKEIVPGIYGRIEVTRATDERVTVTFADAAWNGRPALTAAELRAAAATLTEIADALGEAS